MQRDTGPALKAALLWLTALFALGFSLSFYGFFSALGLGIAIYLAAAVSLFLDPRSFALIAGSVLVATLIALAGLGASAPRVRSAMIYRPYEQLQMYDPRWNVRYYRPNTDLRGFEMPFGDLVPLLRKRARFEGVVDLQPRKVTYRIDDLGFRNDTSYSGESWILVGDSFVAGDDNDQPDILSNQLRRSYGIRTYSVAHPGDPVDYVRLVQYFTGMKAPKEPRLILFLFEGNDFDFYQVARAAPQRLEASIGAPVATAPAAEPSLRERITSLRLRQKETGLYRLTYSIFSRLKYDLFHFRGQVTEGLYARQLGSHKMGFMANYVTRSQASESDAAEKAARLAGSLEPIRSRIAAIVFIPTKYRVYAPLTNPGEKLPERAWRITEQACARLQKPCIDLTRELQAEALAAFERGEQLLFWKDDTHWNRDGIGVAARVVSKIIQSSSKATL